MLGPACAQYNLFYCSVGEILTVVAATRQAEQPASVPLVARLTAELTTWKPTLLFHEGDISYARCARSRARSSTSLSESVCDVVPSPTRLYPCLSRQPRSVGHAQCVLFHVCRSVCMS